MADKDGRQFKLIFQVSAQIHYPLQDLINVFKIELGIANLILDISPITLIAQMTPLPLPEGYYVDSAFIQGRGLIKIELQPSN